LSFVVSAPGRVCLFGDHMDWNWGPVITYATEEFRNYVYVRPRGDGWIHVRSHQPYNVEDRFKADGEINYGVGDLDYVRAVLNVLKERGFSLQGMDMDVKTTIPVGTGLSSSAALCVSTAYAVALFLGSELTALEAAEVAYTAERKRLGINCGQMDPYASALGSVCYLDCSAEPPKRIERLRMERPLPVLVGDTLTPRKAGNVLAWLGLRVKEGDPEMLEGVRRIISLVEEAWRMLSKPDWKPEVIGSLMNRNQRLLREYLRVSTFEIEKLIYASLRAGAYGAKLTGAGGGGCIVALCPEEDGAKRRVVEAVENAGGRSYLTELASEGVREEPAEAFNRLT
jgi:galactokinase